MAAIDFPASPTTGQLFSAANGVTYRYDGTLWLVTAGPGGGTGDFCAIQIGGGAFGATPSTTIVPTILTGNSGGWYNNTTTGRYTPPAGRYYIAASMSAVCPTLASNIGVYIRKNGTVLQSAQQTSFAANQSVEPHLELVVDANGTDWFDMQIYSAQANGQLNNAVFQAFPLTGMQGPAGPDSKLLQTVMFQTGAAATGTGLIPIDDTIPQITEGNEYMTLAITPRSAASKLIIEVIGVFGTAVAGQMVMALFQDSTANALAVTAQLNDTTQGRMLTIPLRHTMTSGTTSATTFRVRAGQGNANTTTFNGTSSVRQFGGVMASSIVIQEVAP